MPDPPIELTVRPEEEEHRLDLFVRRRMPGLSRGSIRRLLASRQILVEGRPAAKGTRLRAGQQVLVATAARDERPVPQPHQHLDVLTVTPELVAINKRPGLASHPLVPGEIDTVANAIAAHYPECVDASPEPREGGLVHRLDWSTSGLLLAARTPAAYGRLRGMFSAGQVVKHYLALVEGQMKAPGKIRSLLRPMPHDRSRVQVLEPTSEREGREAETEYAPMTRLEAHTLVRVQCRTGFRHQVRVHLAHAGFPLAGDEAYGGHPLAGDHGAFLHASRMLLEPEGLELTAPLPSARRKVLRRLGAPTDLEGV